MGNVGKWRQRFNVPSLSDSFSERFFDVITLEQVTSEDTPMSQLADLFAGMAPYSRERAPLLKQLQDENSRQEFLFGTHLTQCPSEGDRERFKVINHLHRRCSSLGLDISFDSLGYLRTWEPKQAVNFWHYEPQHPLDKAPTKND